MIGHSGFHADVSHHHDLGEHNKQQTVHATKESVNDISLPLPRTYTYNLYIPMCM